MPPTCGGRIKPVSIRPTIGARCMATIVAAASATRTGIGMRETMPERCFCGCGGRAGVMHHCLYRQELRRLAKEQDVPFSRLASDRRGLVAASRRCHDNHHARIRPYELSMLPDSVYEFAAEVMGDGPAYVYLSRRYRGGDDRLDLLVSNEKETV